MLRPLLITSWVLYTEVVVLVARMRVREVVVDWGVGVSPLHNTDCSIDSQEMAQLWITNQAKHVRHAARETNKQ